MLVWILALVLLVVPAVIAQEDEIIINRETAPDPDVFTLEWVAAGLQNPLYLTPAGDGSGRLFVLEQSGRIWILEDGQLSAEPFLDLSDKVSQDVLRGYSERGLLGLAFHPNYAENGYFYVNYTDANAEHTTRVERYSVSEADPNRADSESGLTLFTIGQPYANHNGGHLEFGPDGYLYISVGDGGAANDPLAAGQNSGTLLGTMMRIDVDSGSPYGIPDDNPFYSDPMFAPEVWAYGLRNVWRFSFDRATGDLYLADVGQNQWEEVNFEPADSPGGLNYGWVAYEGTHRYRGPEPQGEVVMPFAEYQHSGGNGCSVTGGYIYRGEAIPDLQGVYLFSDYCSGRVWGSYRDMDGNWQTQIMHESQMQISSFGQDEDGELYLINYGGAIWRIVPN
jgi:glucose/arabinose dehydrogenase